MDLGDPGRICPPIRSAVRAFSVGLAAFVILTGCSHDSGSRIRVELRDTPEPKAAAQIGSNRYPCPEADHGDTSGQAVSLTGHSVKLSWNASTSSSGPKDEKILYCLYRTKDGPVQKDTNSPCSNCQRVTKFAVQGTSTDPDGDVEDRAHYCYVAVAVNTKTKEISGFSNQAAAVIPPPPFAAFSCDKKKIEKQGDSKDNRGRR
jgi:hypothetical protein